MKSAISNILICVAFILGSVGTAHGAVLIYEISGPTDSVKYAARAATRSDAEQVVRQEQTRMHSLSSNTTLKILGGCDQPGWYGNVIFLLTPLGENRSFAACGFPSRETLLEKLRSQLAGNGTFYFIKNVDSRYDDGKAGEYSSPQDARVRLKHFHCLAYNEGERFWLENQQSKGRIVVAPDASSLDAVLRCHPKYMPEDAVPHLSR
jgi:hypothetical protein